MWRRGPFGAEDLPVIDNSLSGAACCGGGGGASKVPSSAGRFDFDDEDHKRMLWMLAGQYRHLAGVGVDTEDLVHEVYLSIRETGLPVPRTSLRGVLRGRVMNVARSMRRGSLHRWTRVGLAEVDPAADDGSPQMETAEECRRVSFVLGERTFQWIRLHKVQGLTYEQIGEQEGVSRFTVSKRISEGISRCVA